MTSLAVKSLWARKVRALATTFAVVIGVAFIAGSYILSDTIFAAFDEIFSESLSGTSVVIAAKNPVCLLYTSPSPRDRQRSRMPSSA